MGTKIRTQVPHRSPMTSSRTHESGCMAALRAWVQRALPDQRSSIKGPGRGASARNRVSISAPFNVTMTAPQNPKEMETRAVTVFCASSKGKDVAYTNAAKCASRCHICET